VGGNLEPPVHYWALSPPEFVLQQLERWYEVVSSYFLEGGWLQQTIPGFTPRTEQVEMAAAIAQAIDAGESLAVEAGTGVGKTFAYLIPALLSGKKCLVSTATKNLQDQLFTRDLPRLIQALGIPVQSALLKGRASYLCQYRLELAQSQVLPAFVRVNVEKVAQWAKTTQRGDMSELATLDEGASWLPLVTSTRENCLGSECPQHKTCHVNQARRNAQQADLVVINHHLYFADLKIKDGALGQLLPDADVFIFDEAHQLPDTGIQFLGDQLGSGHILELVRDALMAGVQHARGLAPWQDICGHLEKAVRDWRISCSSAPARVRLTWRSISPDGVAQEAWLDSVETVQQALSQLMQALQSCEELAPDFQKLVARCSLLQNLLSLFSQPCPPGSARWLELGKGLRLTQTPLEIGDWMRTNVWVKAAQAKKCLIFASATLAESTDLVWFTRAMGLTDARTMQLGSPYDYASQAGLYVPRVFPAAGTREHPVAVADLTATVARKIGGRTMVLTTSLRALKEIGARLKELLSADFEVLVQGDAPRQILVERFRTKQERGGMGAARRVLVGSVSFWEGVDIAGHALMAVVIDKLPFPVPSDPWVRAKSEQIEALGQSSFNTLSLPTATVALKQGAGRLIRSEDDCGVLIVCDPRLVNSGYGRRMRTALPAMRLLSSEAELTEQLDLLSNVVQQPGSRSPQDAPPGL
jgi:ATP-dependent DNA helicase DinG